MFCSCCTLLEHRIGERDTLRRQYYPFRCHGQSPKNFPIHTCVDPNAHFTASRLLFSRGMELPLSPCENSSQNASTLLWIGQNFPVYGLKKCASVHFDTCCSPFLVARGTQHRSSPSALSGKQESKRLTRQRTGSTQRERWPPQAMRGPCCKKE